MRFNFFVLNSLGLSAYVAADMCNDVCKKMEGLCDEEKGSWCTSSSVCQNIFVLPDRELCYQKSGVNCDKAAPLACSEAAVKAEEALTAKKHKEILEQMRVRMAQRTPEEVEQARHFFRPLDHQPVFGETGCVIC